MARKARRKKRTARPSPPRRGARGDRYTAGELFLAGLGGFLLLFFLGMLITSLL